MSWQAVIVLNIFIFALAQILIKLIVDKLPRAQALSLQFLINALIMSLYVLVTGHFRFSGDALKVIPVGFFVAFGAYCQWRAIAISLSRTSLFFPLSGVLTFILATIFLGEAEEWNFELIGGAILCFLAVFLFWSQLGKKEKGAQGDQRKWLFFVGGIVLILGMANFLIKVFSSDIPQGEFLLYWYLGTFLGSLPLLYLERQNHFQWPGKLVFLVPLASLAVLGNLATQYWAFQLTLVSRVVPFQSVGTTFLPILIGWLIFKERKGLSKKELLAFAIGIAGNLLIVLS